MITAKWYGQALLKALSGEVNVAAGVKGMLCSSAYTPDQATHVYKSQVSGEVTASGYTAGGVALTGVALAYNPTTRVVSLDAGDVSFAAVTVTARYLVLYASAPSTDATRPLLGYVDFGQDVVSPAVEWDPLGALTVTVG